MAMWERVDDAEEEAEPPKAWEPAALVFERVDDCEPDDDPSDRWQEGSSPAQASPSVCPVIGRLPAPLPASIAHSKEGRLARAALLRLSIAELRSRLRVAGSPCDDLTAREALAERLLNALGPEAVLAKLQPDVAGEARAEARAEGSGGGSLCRDAPRSSSSCDYSKFDRIDYVKEYGINDDDAVNPAAVLGDMPDVQGTTLEERRKLMQKLLEDVAGKADLKAPPPPPAPECHPVVICEPPACFVDPPAETWMGGEADSWEKDGLLHDLEADDSDGGALQGGRAEIQAGVTETGSAQADAPDTTRACGASSEEVHDGSGCNGGPAGAAPSGKGRSSEVWEALSDDDVCEPLDDRQQQVADSILEPAEQRSAIATRVAETYESERRKFNEQARNLEAVDIDGWNLEKSQLDLVEEMDEDLVELRILLACCQSGDNRERLRKAIREFTLKLRERRTWAWFPLTMYTWTGFEYEKPTITLDFRVPGAGSLPAEDIHCEFGTDWFDLKIWNVFWPEDPGVKYHHRVKKTRLMRDIVPSESSVSAKGDHVYVKLQKVVDPRHGYCAWPDLAAGKGRKPFKYDEDAPDGGLMEFFEGEYEKHEGYDGFRRDIGKAMEKVHRGEPIRGIPDTPLDED